MVKARKRKSIPPHIPAGCGKRVALVVSSVRPLLLDSWGEWFVWIPERAVRGVLGSAPCVRDCAGKAGGDLVLDRNLQTVGNDARSGIGGELAHGGAEQLIAYL